MAVYNYIQTSSRPPSVSTSMNLRTTPWRLPLPSPWPIPIKDRQKEKGKTKEKTSTLLYSSSGRATRTPPLSSRSETLLWASSSSPSDTPLHPTSVGIGKSKIAFAHRSVPDLRVVLPPPRLFSRLCPHDFLLPFPTWAVLEQMLPRLCLCGHHQHLSAARLSVHWRYCPVRQCPVFS